MIDFLIKSSICLLFLYVFYCILLRNSKTFEFNRFYLLFTLIFSITIPFISFKLGFSLPINQNIQEYSTSTNGFIVSGNIVGKQSNSVFSIANVGLFSYIIVSLILLIRLIYNLYKIIKKIRISEKTEKGLLKNGVLSAEKKLPYSFFNYIIINKNEYEKGEIKNEILIHEQAHCEQYHSVDILLIEFIKVLIWVNPVIWIIKKEIQLNHEYLADDAVLLEHDRKTYQNIILNLVFRNNSTYLASNFNYSLTKNRLIMLKKTSSTVNTMVRKIVIVPLVLILTATITFSQENVPKECSINLNNESGDPIIEDKIVTLIDALFIIKNDNDEYTSLKSPLAYYNLDKNIVKGEIGTLETFSSNNSDTKPITSLEMKGFKYKIEGNKGSVEADRLVLNLRK